MDSIEHIQEIIQKTSFDIWLPEHIRFKNTNTSSWFDFKYFCNKQKYNCYADTNIGQYHSCNECTNCIHNTKCKHCNKSIKGYIKKCVKCKKKVKYKKCSNQPDFQDIIKCKKINITLDPLQKFIIKRWNIAYTRMYNVTIHRINVDHRKYTSKFHKYSDKIKKSGKSNTRKIDRYKKRLKSIRSSLTKLKNFFETRKILKEIRDTIKDDSGKPSNEYPEISTKNCIPTHILDTAIKRACANYKSAMSNMVRGNIRHFKLRHLKDNRKNQVFTVEQGFFSNNTMCSRSLGKIEGTYDGEPFDFSEIKSIYKKDCLFSHNTITNKYMLYVPYSVGQENLNQKREFISIDPGLRTFMTGISENEVVAIGNNMMDKFKNYYNKKKSIQKIDSSSKRKRKLRKLKLKIDNQIDDMHWKIISYLTKRYRNVIIGNMSTKEITKKGGSLKGKYKDMTLLTKLYVFRQRLEYKCKERCVNYKMVSERYTSKLCSLCGDYNDVGKSKTYNCDNCKLTIDRDVNGARNIYFKRLL